MHAPRARERRAHAQAARDAPRLLLDGFFEDGQLSKQPAAFSVVGGARIGQAHLARGALDQHRAKVCFQCTELLAEAGGRHVQVLGRFGEAAQFDDAPEGAHVVEGVHDRNEVRRIP
ncbi:hypothetical protein G6F59_018453 [Rhizopus arrhizus]|nr:hypothetical protein G6F59_018453 [Rhizopus arrhizus]